MSGLEIRSPRRTSSARKAPTKRQVGPWAQPDLASFLRLCNDACDLGAPTIQGGLLAPASSQYANLDAARKALHAHSIYRWLKSHVRQVLEKFEKHRPAVSVSGFETTEFRFLRILVQWMTACWLVAGRTTAIGGRSDKSDEAAVRAIERVERHLSVVLAHLSNATKREMLAQLLVEAKKALLKSRPLGRKHPRGILRALADTLMRDFGFAEPSVLLQIAESVGIDLSKRDAERYCKKARESVPAPRTAED